MPDVDDSSAADAAGHQRRSRAAQQAETRENLLAAALEVFVERGFHGASVEAIARRAGYTKGAIYANFTDKDQLFLAVVDRRIAAGVSSLDGVSDLPHTGALPDRGGAGPESGGHPDGDTGPDSGSPDAPGEPFESRWGVLAFETILYAVREKPELLAEIAKRYQHIDEVTTAYLRQKAADPPEAIDELAIAQNALGEGLMVRHLADPERITPEMIERIFDLVFDPAHREAWKRSDR